MPDSNTSSSEAAPFLARTLVIIPALNEAACIADTVRYWLRRGAAFVRVADNGSTDETARRAVEAGAEVIRESRRGYGAACWTGLLNFPERLEWILFSSADGSDQLSPEEAAAWQSAIDAGADLVMGDRFSAPESRRHLKPVQRFGNRLCCALILLGWRARFRDMASLRLLRKTAFDAMALEDRGFGWNIEMQVRAVELGLHWVELPIAYHPRAAGESKISGSFRGTLRAARGMMAMTASLWLRKQRRRR